MLLPVRTRAWWLAVGLFTLSPRGSFAQAADNLITPQTVRVACANPRIERRTIADTNGGGVDAALKSMLLLCHGLKFPDDFGAVTTKDTTLFGIVMRGLPTVATVKAFDRAGREQEKRRAALFANATQVGRLFGADSLAPGDVANLDRFAKDLQAFMNDYPEERISILTPTPDSAFADTTTAGRKEAFVGTQLALVMETLRANGVDTSRIKTGFCPRYTGKATPVIQQLIARSRSACNPGSVQFRLPTHESIPFDRRIQVIAKGDTAQIGFAVTSAADKIHVRELFLGAAAPSVPLRSAPAWSAPSTSTAIVDAVLFEVQSELEAGMLDRALLHLCTLDVGTEKVAALMPRTCRLRAVDALTPLSLPAIRSTVSVDLREFPLRLANLGLKDPRMIQADRSGQLLTLTFSLQALNSAPRSAWEYLEEFADSLGRMDARYQKTPVGRALLAVAGLSRMLHEDTDAKLLVAGVVDTTADGEESDLAEHVESTIMAFAVMAGDPATVAWWKTTGLSLPSGASVARLYDNTVTLVRLAPSIDSLARGVRSPDLSSAARVLQVLIAAMDAARRDDETDAPRAARELAVAALELQQLARQSRWRELLVRVDEISDSTTLNLKFSESWRRVMSFAVELAEAQDGSDMSAAVRSFVREGKGFRGKRMAALPTFTRRYMRINAYLSYVPSYDLREQWQKGLWKYVQSAPYLPVGFEFGRRRPGSLDEGRKLSWSHGVFLQVADLGAVGAARLSSDTAVINNVTYGQLFSPGIFYVRGWKSSILASSIGIVYAREAFIEESPKRKQGTVRLQIMLAGFDVPLFP